MTKASDNVLVPSVGATEVLWALLAIGTGGTDGDSCGGCLCGIEGAEPSLRAQSYTSSGLSDSLCEATRGIGGRIGGLAETGDPSRLLV